jgi:hypothetical protein
MGRYLIMQIYRSMRNSAKTIPLEISKLRDQKIPILNNILGRHLHIPPRNLRRVPRHYRWQYRKSYYIRKGIHCKVKAPNPDLLEVGWDMMDAGFKIPLLFRKFFVEAQVHVGSLDPSLKPRLERDRRVWGPRARVGTREDHDQNISVTVLELLRISPVSRPERVPTTNSDQPNPTDHLLDSHRSRCCQ